MQSRIEELESMKKNNTNSNDLDSPVTNRRKSLLLLHELQRRMSLPRSKAMNNLASTSIETETSSSSSTTDDQSLFNFDQRSINRSRLPSQEPTTPKLDRSRLTISIPHSNSNLLKPVSSASSTEDVAQIDTELKLTLLSQENSNQITPLLYSKTILNRTIEFRPYIKKN